MGRDDRPTTRNVQCSTVVLELASHVPRAWLRSLSVLISQDILLLTCLAESVQDPTQTNPGIWARVRNSLALESYVRPGSRKSRSSRMGATIESLHYKDDMESPTSTHSHPIAPSHSTFTTLLTTTTTCNDDSGRCRRRPSLPSFHSSSNQSPAVVDVTSVPEYW